MKASSCLILRGLALSSVTKSESAWKSLMSVVVMHPVLASRVYSILTAVTSSNGGFHTWPA